MNFLGLGPKLQPVHIHWILYLNDPKRYQERLRYPNYLSFVEVAFYDRKKTVEEAKHRYFGDPTVADLIRIIEDADTDR